MRLMLISLYATEVVPRESDELGKLFLSHKALYSICLNTLADVHNHYCRHLLILLLFIQRRSNVLIWRTRPCTRMRAVSSSTAVLLVYSIVITNSVEQ